MTQIQLPPGLREKLQQQLAKLPPEQQQLFMKHQPQVLMRLQQQLLKQQGQATAGGVTKIPITVQVCNSWMYYTSKAYSIWKGSGGMSDVSFSDHLAAIFFTFLWGTQQWFFPINPVQNRPIRLPCGDVKTFFRPLRSMFKNACQTPHPYLFKLNSPKSVACAVQYQSSIITYCKW